MNEIEKIEVGPLGIGYVYRIGDYISYHRYHNVASARWNAHRPQHLVDGKLEPDAVSDAPGTIWL